jgi:probable HAF family extracellular repeat protein
MMWFLAFLLGLAPGSPRAGAGRSCRRPARRNPAACRLHAEPLEARCCPSASYSVTDLGTLPGGAAGGSEAFAINKTGQVVGWAWNGSQVDAFLWTPSTPNGTIGTMIDLGTLGGNSTSGLPSSWALAINNASKVQVVGEAFTAGSGYHAFLWTQGGTDGVPSNLQMKDLGTLPGDTNSTAYGINDAGNVVGATDNGMGAHHPFLWQNGVMTNLDPNGGTATAINDAGQVTGAATEAVLWQNGQMYDLGNLGGNSSLGRAINSNGQVAGQSYRRNDDEFHAFSWTPSTPHGTTGKMTDLGTLKLGGTINNSDAYGINDAGDVVGWSGIDLAVSLHAFYWPGKGSIQDLNSLIPANPPGFSFLQNATGINDGGQIAGWGYSSASTPQTGQIDRAFLLTPVGGQSPMAARIRSRAATDTATGSIAGAHTGIVVQPAAAVRFILSAPSSVTHRLAFSLTLTVHDVNGHVATGYTGTVLFSRSDGTATLPRNYTFTAADAGVHTFTGVILRKKGKQTITVIDALNSALATTDSITVV